MTMVIGNRDQSVVYLVCSGLLSTHLRLKCTFHQNLWTSWGSKKKWGSQPCALVSRTAIEVLALGQLVEVKVLVLCLAQECKVDNTVTGFVLAGPSVAGSLSPTAEPLSVSLVVPKTLQVTWYHSVRLHLSLLFATKTLLHTAFKYQYSKNNWVMLVGPLSQCMTTPSCLLTEEEGKQGASGSKSRAHALLLMCLHKRSLKGCQKMGGPSCGAFWILQSNVCVLMSPLSSNCWPPSNPFLIFYFPANFKIALNCKLEVDLLLFLALKEEVWAYFGSFLLFCSLLEGSSKEGLCNFHLFPPWLRLSAVWCVSLWADPLAQFLEPNLGSQYV